ncbi:MAG: hypothetical protein RQ763_00825 [Sulfurimonas sp.]|uniref:hypothetical protein n=1 Tax=Sulfurimonas sp. TaxID=2022749 RepID=UPI0028CE6E89|nr:hypothetical protein [Sulfurimonas sp.]MDT8337718.1 hypothetical protein [Sulfurimonas sp.]
MKKSIAASLFCFLIISLAEADTFERNFSLKTVDSFEVGVQSYLYEYEEEVDGAFFMSNKGTKYGLSASATKTLADEYYLKGEFRYATGDVEYKSASGVGDVSDDLHEMRLVVAKEKIVDGFLLGSYIGVGYRVLENDLRDLGSGGYRRTSQYLYIPIGVNHRFRVGNSARISTNIEYDYFAWGEQKSYLSDVSPFYSDLVHEQKSGYGFRINSAYEQQSWSIGAFFNYWKIEDSEIKDYYYEPENSTKEVGVELKYRF